MKIQPRCYPCQIKRVLSELKLCNLPIERELEIAQRIIKFYGESEEKRSSWLGRDSRTLLSKLTAIKDPYKEMKKKANQFAMEQLPIFRKYVDSISDPFEKFQKACLGSVIGNLMEFFLIEHEFDLKLPKPIPELLDEEVFSIDHLKKTYELLSQAKNILLLTDNAGEIAFDKVLLEEISRQFPKINIFVALKPTPIINDATLEDAKMINMEEIPNLKVIDTGTNSIGLFLEESSKEFKKVWYSSDLIIKKGMGHAETRDELGEKPPCPILYLLRIKCTTVGELLGVKLKQNIALLDIF